MKKILVYTLMLSWSALVSGQRPVDELLKAKALISRGESKEAISYISSSLDIHPDYSLYLERAEAKIALGDYSGAISDLNESNRMAPGSGEFGLARIYALKGDAATSMYHLDLNLSSPFRKNEKEIMLDPSFGAIENKIDWRNFWKKNHYSELERKISEIEYYSSLGKTSECESILSGIRADYQGSDEALYAEALASYSSGKISDATRFTAGLILKYPGNEKYLRLLARIQESSSNPAGASDTYTRLLDSGVADASLIISRAECYRKTGENEKALADIRKYLDLYPDDRKAISLAGKTEALSGDNLKAIQFFSRNLELHPNDADCYIERANAYLVSKSWEWAIKDYSMSLDLKPGNSDAWLNKGIALLNKGLVEDACHDFRKSLGMGNKRASEYISRNCIR